MNIPPSYTTILFDFDGCLADTLSIWMKAYLDCYKKFGVTDITPQDIVAKSWGNWEQGPLNFGITDNLSCMDEITKEVMSNRFEVTLNPGVRDVLEKLHEQKKKMAILSSSKRVQVLDPLEKLNIASFFPFVLCEEDVKNLKPHPEIVLTALERLGSSKEETLLIGDSSGDVLAGQGASVDTVIYYPHKNHLYYNEENLKALNPTYFITEFSQLLAIIN